MSEKERLRLHRKEEFIKALAQYLAGDAARMSILLEMNKTEALDWAKLYQKSGISGWCTVAEAEQELKELLQ